MRVLFIWGNRLLIGLLSSIVAGLRRPVPISIEHVCNKVKIYVSVSINAFPNDAHNEFYTYFHLPIALVVVGWCNGLLNVHLLQKSLNVSDVKFGPISEIIFFRSPYLQIISLVICTGLSANRLSTLFTVGNYCGGPQYKREFCH